MPYLNLFPASAVASLDLSRYENMYAKALINPALQQSSEIGGLGHPLEF